MWFTVLITPLISSNFPCWSLHCLSCDLPFWLPLWYLQTFLVGQCIACHVIYRSDYHFDIFKLFCCHCISCHVIYSSDYPFDIFKLFLLVIVLPVMWFTVLITPLISSNFSVSVLPVMWFTVLITTLISSNFSCWSLYFLSCYLPFCLPLWYLQTFLVGHCIACHVIYRSDYPFDIFKPFL